MGEHRNSLWGEHRNTVWGAYEFPVGSIHLLYGGIGIPHVEHTNYVWGAKDFCMGSIAIPNGMHRNSARGRDSAWGV